MAKGFADSGAKPHFIGHRERLRERPGIPQRQRPSEREHQREGRGARLSSRDETSASRCSNGTSRDLRARIARDLAPGLARIPRDDAIGLHEYVEVSK